MSPTAHTPEAEPGADRRAQRRQRQSEAAAKRERRYARLAMQPNEMLVRRRGCGCCD